VIRWGHIDPADVERMTGLRGMSGDILPAPDGSVDIRLRLDTVACCSTPAAVLQDAPESIDHLKAGTNAAARLLVDKVEQWLTHARRATFRDTFDIADQVAQEIGMRFLRPVDAGLRHDPSAWGCEDPACTRRHRMNGRHE
jgi:hypothetical protein